jgi:hypothetical protein
LGCGWHRLVGDDALRGVRAIRLKLTTRTLVACALVGALGIGVGIAVTASGSSPAARRSGPASQAGGDVSKARTFLGPDGVESTAIIAENKRPGTTSWQISAAPSTGYIDGFSDKNYVSVGESVGLYVSTTARYFRVVAYRMGWYQGKGGREVWRSKTVHGRVQPVCRLTAGINMVSCANWSRSLSFQITSAFVQGDYLLKLLGAGHLQSYVLLTVWDPTSSAVYLVMSRSLTEQGWNTYGGYSFYQGMGPCPPASGTYPPCNRARVVSFDRPYAEGDGASDFLSNEFPLVSFMEEHGLDVAYVTDITVDEHPSLLLRHRALLSLGHDETWTYAEREGAQTALDHGVNIAFLSAAAIVRHARLEQSPLGPDRQEVDYRDSTADPLDGKGNPLEVTGNTWSSPPTSWPSTGFVGELYSGYLEPGFAARPFVVWDPSAWIFRGTGLHRGSAIPGVIASDIDHLAPGAGSPTNIEVLGHSPMPLSETYTNMGQWGADTYADMTYYTDPHSRAGVFDSGTVNWVDALSPCGTSSSCPSGLVGKITGNLLWLFGQGPAGRRYPSHPNWQDVTPSGS